MKEEKKQISNANKLLFSDTELIVAKIWLDVKYGNCDKWILDKIDEQKFDLYLLCDIDLPWEFDVLREHPEQREYLMKLYINELFIRKLNYAVISGIGEQRINNAISFIEKLL